MNFASRPRFNDGAVESLQEVLHCFCQTLPIAGCSAVRAAARNEPSCLDMDEVDDLVQAYLAHACFEVAQFLPLADRILGRNDDHMAALGLALHLRHAAPVVGYI